LFCFLPSPVSAAACDTFYPATFQLVEGKLNPPIPPLTKPGKGEAFKEPSFSTCMFRATDHRTEPSSFYLRNDYSRRQAFNATSTYFLAYSNDGSWHLYDANTLVPLRELPPGGDAEPQWHPTDPNTLYYLPTNGGLSLLKVDVRTNAITTVVDFRGKLPAWAATATHLWTRSEGAPSANGRYWGFLAYDDGWNLLGYVVWDLQNAALVGSRQANGGVDNASISATGRWFVVSADAGVWAWSADFTRKVKIANNGGVHSDLALGATGHDLFVSADYQSDAGGVYFVDLDTCPTVSASSTTAPLCERTVLFSMYTTGGWSTLHFSGKAFATPGWVLVSTYDTQSNTGTLPWFKDKVFALQLKANPKIYPLAFTRRVAPQQELGQTGADAYWTEPHATVNRDFTRISFNSNWGNPEGADIDIYTIQLPAHVLDGVPPSSLPVRRTGGRLPPLRKPPTTAPARLSHPTSSASATSVSVCPLCAYVAHIRNWLANKWRVSHSSSVSALYGPLAMAPVRAPDQGVPPRWCAPNAGVAIQAWRMHARACLAGDS
jgi:hypothetical protein